MPRLRTIYAILALVGAAVPVYMHTLWLMASNWNFAELPLVLTASNVVAAITIVVWVLVECFRRKRWIGLLAIPATCFLGPSCGLPFYLWLRMDSKAR